MPPANTKKVATRKWGYLKFLFPSGNISIGQHTCLKVEKTPQHGKTCQELYHKLGVGHFTCKPEPLVEKVIRCQGLH